MALKVVQAELLKTLDAQVSVFHSGPYKMGLYKNNWTPADTDTIAAVTPADFSGYAGLQNLTSWTAAAWVSPRAVSTRAALQWTHNGGATNNDIYGYYVVDQAGNLAWAERYSGAPVTMSNNGQIYQVTPQYTRRSEF